MCHNPFNKLFTINIFIVSNFLICIIITSDALISSQCYMAVCICWHVTVKFFSRSGLCVLNFLLSQKHLRGKAISSLSFATFCRLENYSYSKCSKATQVGWHNLLGRHANEELFRGDLQILHIFSEWLACWNGKSKGRSRGSGSADMPEKFSFA